MDYYITIFMLLCIFTTGCSASKLGGRLVFSVVNYGATGDGKTDDSNAFLGAWNAMCGANANHVYFIVPSGKKFLLKQIKFKGPCKPLKIHFQVLGTIIAPQYLSGWDLNNSKWITFQNINGLSMSGPGGFDGQGQVWWTHHCKFAVKNSNPKKCRPPNALSFHKCKELRLYGLSHVNSQRCHISIDNCEGVILSKLTIVSLGISPNTDGVDISDSYNVTIQHSQIGTGTGDDCVAINEGSSHITIRHVVCGPGHGISVGSLGAHGSYNTVQDVDVTNITFINTFYGARIKTWQGGSGYARNISFTRLTLHSVKHPVLIDQYYCTDDDKCKNSTRAVQVSDVKFNTIEGSSKLGEVVALNCSTTMPCTRIIMSNINITSETKEKAYASCTNAHGTAFNITSPYIPCLSS